ncbi:type IV pilus biogenesis/stability protein PilW [Ferribacterium limneticum]|uniref:type IV pilus biogenesis/stability protein PilW n=1 Tax=Ferribacterium limneticum TaxID=76259 RepID=UPI001CFAED5B|nr:type IV pilus biogenesis/stability protein PilW [Ferribacterium limneticum]UCV29675.1 type IV pilus biogenesis/stability protein PilW [Ferribacterium limneticum]UCV33594.1 type IV pilus biogenesis/stability protein PilW [Ferribacterium limneticum]
MKVFSLKNRIAGICLGVLCVISAQAQYDFNPSATNQSQGSDQRNRAKVHTELGAMYFQAGNPGVALDELRIALSADSSYYPAYSVRGLVHSSLKEYSKAEDDFSRALNLAPNDPEVNNNYGWYLCETGKERQSITYFLNALKSPLYETPDRAYTNAGTCALKAGDLEGAQSYLLKALQMARDGAAPARLQLAKLFFMRGILEEARIYLGDALKMMEPPSAEALWLGLRIERKQGNRSAESGYASQLRGRYPSSPEYQEFLKGNFE